MKIVSITYTKKPGFDHPEDWLRRISPSIGILETLGKRHSVFRIDRIDYSGIYALNGVEHHFPAIGDDRLTAPWKLNRFARRLDPDIVLVEGMIFPLQVIQLRMQLGRRARIIVQNHAEKPGKGRRKLLQRLADPCIDAYLFAAKEMGEEWVRQDIIRRPDKIREVMEASSAFLPIDRGLARIHVEVTGSPVFLWVGRLDRNKDPLTVLRAFLEFSVIQPSARLYMIYHTSELLPSVNTLLDQLPAARDRVILVGEQPHAEMGCWYSAADFIVSGSHYEGSGIAVCEAMSCGCIPVLTDILSFRKMTAGGGCGILYAAGDEKALLAALQRVTALDRTVQREKVLQQFRTELSFEAIAGTIQRIAESL